MTEKGMKILLDKNKSRFFFYSLFQLKIRCQKIFHGKFSINKNFLMHLCTLLMDGYYAMEKISYEKEGNYGATT
jgi:hypothetical protein